VDLADALPGFADELAELFVTAGRPDLARQCPALEVVAPCACGQEDCGGFYTGPRPHGAWGPGHESVVLAPANGMVIVDVVHGVIRFVEVLDRSDVRDAVRTAFRQRA